MSGSASPSPTVATRQNSSPPEAVDGSTVTWNRGELRAEAGEKRIARGVAERVVVALEAVEVEQHQQRRRHGVAGQPPLEVGEELTPIREARERVGRRLLAGQLE